LVKEREGRNCRRKKVSINKVGGLKYIKEECEGEKTRNEILEFPMHQQMAMP